jgi:hypothetical protein
MQRPAQIRVRSFNLDPRGDVLVALTFFLASLLAGCHGGGVGDPCVPEEEYSRDFASFAAEEADTESRSLQCQTRVCLINHFQGRVSCPYGQGETQALQDPRCFVPGTSTPVHHQVEPQLLQRRADDAVYCSCRCDGPDSQARYCECPSGFSCTPVLPKLGLGQDELSGSYCVREGTVYDRDGIRFNEVCDASQKNCE